MSASNALLKSATDRCVKCALCLPVCPTYSLTRDEAQSPRGRIALIQGLLEGALSPAGTLPHIDPCLACRACEKVCPADVPYGAVLDGGRELIRAAGIRPALHERLAAALLASPFLLRGASMATRLLRRLPLIGRGDHRLARALAMPSRSGRARTAARYPVADARGAVALLAGCVTEHFEARASIALCRLLNACGYTVDVIPGCCGGLHQHQGRLTDARGMAEPLLAQLAASDHVAVLHPATGCAAAVRDYGRLVDTRQARRVAARVTDAGAFLRQAGLAVKLRACARDEATVVLHAPCTQRNVLGGHDDTLALLQALPGVTVMALNNSGCCGAAGSKMLDARSNAAELARKTLEPLRDAGPVDVLVSPNIGCAWHLRSTLARRGAATAVLHPAEFLARRLGL